MLRRYTPFDYQVIKKWADLRQFPLVPQEYLPVTGFIHENHCVGFLYKTDSKICWLEWVISNPDSDKFARSAAIDEIIQALATEARVYGFKVMFTSVEHTKLIERYKSLGFSPTEQSMTNMVRRLE